MNRDADWLRERPVAHRGAHDAVVPENSLLAFQRAVDAGFAVELDVRGSADGDVYVFHDDNLARMTGLDHPFHAADQDTLRGMRLRRSDQHVPRLEEVLDLIAGRVPLLVELKNSGKVGPIESRVASLLRTYNGPSAVMSFNPFRMGWFARHAADVVRGQLAGDFRDATLAPWKKVVLSRMWLNRVSRPDFIAYDVRCLPHPGVIRTRERGTTVLTWTVDSAEKLAAARRWADNIIFEALEPGDVGGP